MKCRKKSIVVEAHQWFKNGDHPEDNCRLLQPFEGDKQIFNSEGEVVRYFRHPNIPGTDFCKGFDKTGKPIGCGRMFHDHGWIDTLEGGHIVCPADWIITGIMGERYPCKPDIFEATYEAV